LLLLISSLPVRKQPWTRERRIPGMAGLLGLLSVAGSIYWHTYDLYTHSYWGLVRPDSVIYAFYLARRILGGATIAMFAFVMFPKGAKVLLSISVALFVVSEALGMTHNGHWGLATPVISLANAWSVGMAIPAAIIFLLDRQKHELSSL
jgi:hypothetical protein